MISLLQLTRKSSIKLMKWLLFLFILLSMMLVVGHFGQAIANMLTTYRFYLLIVRWLMIVCLYCYWHPIQVFLNRHFRFNLPLASDSQIIRNKIILLLILFELMIVEQIPMRFFAFIKDLFV